MDKTGWGQIGFEFFFAFSDAMKQKMKQSLICHETCLLLLGFAKLFHYIAYNPRNQAPEKGRHSEPRVFSEGVEDYATLSHDILFKGLFYIASCRNAVFSVPVRYGCLHCAKPRFHALLFPSCAAMASGRIPIGFVLVSLLHWVTLLYLTTCRMKGTRFKGSDPTRFWKSHKSLTSHESLSEAVPKEK